MAGWDLSQNLEDLSFLIIILTLSGSRSCFFFVLFKKNGSHNQSDLHLWWNIVDLIQGFYVLDIKVTKQSVRISKLESSILLLSRATRILLPKLRI